VALRAAVDRQASARGVRLSYGRCSLCSVRRNIAGSPMLNIKVIHASDFIRATPDGKAKIEKAE
jgi:hypothetical protein